MFAGYPYQRTDYQNSSEYYLFLCSLGSEVLGAMVAVFLRQTYSTNINKDMITSIQQQLQIQVQIQNTNAE